MEVNSIMTVLGIVLVIWFGIFSYIFFIDRKISKIEKKLENDDYYKE
jgi:CcmD family protein